jgi:hypothetical protein
VRRPTRTVRVDLQTHADLRRLASEWSAQLGMRLSVADVVRMGVTLLALRRRRMNRRRA